jgi:hypothetical protein
MKEFANNWKLLNHPMVVSHWMIASHFAVELCCDEMMNATRLMTSPVTPSEGRSHSADAELGDRFE